MFHFLEVILNIQINEAYAACLFLKLHVVRIQTQFHHSTHQATAFAVVTMPVCFTEKEEFS
jgi:hypothetical protein